MLNMTLLDDTEQTIVREYICRADGLPFCEYFLKKGDTYAVIERYPPSHHFDGEENAA